MPIRYPLALNVAAACLLTPSLSSGNGRRVCSPALWSACCRHRGGLRATARFGKSLAYRTRCRKRRSRPSAKLASSVSIDLGRPLRRSENGEVKVSPRKRRAQNRARVYSLKQCWVEMQLVWVLKAIGTPLRKSDPTDRCWSLACEPIRPQLTQV